MSKSTYFFILNEYYKFHEYWEVQGFFASNQEINISGCQFLGSFSLICNCGFCSDGGKKPLNTTSLTACIEKGMQASSYIHYMQGCNLFICVQYNFMSTRTWIKALHVGQMKWTSSATSWHCECITTKRSFENQPMVPGLVIQNPFGGNILLNISFNILSNYWKVFPLGLIIMVTFFRE